MKSIPVREAVGLTLCHDITEIIPDSACSGAAEKGEGRGRKGPAFKRGHVVRPEDVERLLSLGKEHLFVWDLNTEGLVHEDDAARRIAGAIAGPGTEYGEPSEGRINIRAARDGLLTLDPDLLYALNSVPDVTIATLHSMQAVQAGRTVAGCRVIPLVTREEHVAALENALQGREPLLGVLPFKPRRVGLVTTGSEVYHGRVKDAFGPVLERKFTALGSSIHSQKIVPDDAEGTRAAIVQSIAEGADFIAVTGGMSVDPDDLSPAAIRAACDEVVTYGAPIFPGAMFMLGYAAGPIGPGETGGPVGLGGLGGIVEYGGPSGLAGEPIPVVGLPGCVMYHRASIFDLIVPRLLAGLRVSRADIIRLGHGGLCENCPECRHPVCAFGKG